MVIPVQNRAELLHRALQSVSAQTLLPNKVVVVDDASDPEIVLGEEFCFPVEVIRNNNSFGAAFSRNMGARASSAKYIAFLDSDDYWEPGKLEKQYEHAEATSADLVYCDCVLEDAMGNRQPSGKELPEAGIMDRLLEFWTAPNTSTLFFRRDSFLALGGFDPKLASCQDHDLWFRVADADLLVRCVPEPLSIFWRGAENRISADFERRRAGIQRFLENNREMIIARRGATFFKEFSDRYYARVFVGMGIQAIRQRRLGILLSTLKLTAFNRQAYAEVAGIASRKLKR